jgi:hypothetical protein
MHVVELPVAALSARFGDLACDPPLDVEDGYVLHEHCEQPDCNRCPDAGPDDDPPHRQRVRGRRGNAYGRAAASESLKLGVSTADVSD